MHQGLVTTRFKRCESCGRDAAFDVVTGFCTVVNCRNARLRAVATPHIEAAKPTRPARPPAYAERCSGGLSTRGAFWLGYGLGLVATIIGFVYYLGGV